MKQSIEICLTQEITGIHAIYLSIYLPCANFTLSSVAKPWRIAQAQWLVFRRSSVKLNKIKGNAIYTVEVIHRQVKMRHWPSGLLNSQSVCIAVFLLHKFYINERLLSISSFQQEYLILKM